VNAVVLVKLPKIPLLANKKSQTVHGISSLSQVMGLAAYKLGPTIGSVHGLTLVPKYLPLHRTARAYSSTRVQFPFTEGVGVWGLEVKTQL